MYLHLSLKNTPRKIISSENIRKFNNFITMISINQETEQTLNNEVVKTCLQPRKAERAVSFCASVKIRSSLHINDYTNSEVDNCWFAPEDYKEMKRETRHTVDLIERKIKFDEEEYCRRGVEHKTDEVTAVRWKERAAAIDAVMDEQDIQIDESICDPEMIAIVYTDRVYRSKMAAYLTAVSDEHIARALNIPPAPKTIKNSKKQQSDHVRVTWMSQNRIRFPRKLFSSAA
jgi:hypothetical protein